MQETGNHDFRLNTVVFNVVIYAWPQSGDHYAGGHANWYLEEAEAESQKDCGPDEQHTRCIITAMYCNWVLGVLC